MTRCPHGPNVRLDGGMVHDAKARAGRTECEIRFVLYGSISKALGIPIATETTDEVDCMTCLVKGAT